MEMIAYHGTREEDVDSILKEGFTFTKYKINFLEQQDMPGDLGNGVYAYKKEDYYNGSENALKIAQRYKPATEHRVLELNVDCDEDDLLDFDDEYNEEKLANYYKTATAYIYKNFKAIKSSSSKDRGCLDGITIELFLNRHRLKPKIIKKKTFTKFDEKMKISNIRNGTELCIRDTKIIKTTKII